MKRKTNIILGFACGILALTILPVGIKTFEYNSNFNDTHKIENDSKIWNQTRFAQRTTSRNQVPRDSGTARNRGAKQEQSTQNNGICKVEFYIP